MNRTILLASIFAAGAAFADPVNVNNPVVSENAIGVLQVATTEKPRQILLSAPFAGYVGESIAATNLVSPANLPVGTALRVANGSDYDSWTVNLSRQWEPVTAIQVGGEGKVASVGGSGTVGRGNAFWLEFPENSEKPTSVTLVGQEDTKAKQVVLVQKKWNLVGNPGVGAFDLLAAGKIERVEDGDGDQICIQKKDGTLKTYRYNGEAWYSGWDKFTSIWVQPGDGCWFYAASATAINF